MQFGAHDQDIKIAVTVGDENRSEIRREGRRREPGDGPGGDDYQTVSYPEERRGMVAILRRLHPADVMTFLENLLPVSPVPAPQTQPGPLRRDCDTVVAASVLCGAVSANMPNFVCDSDDYFYGVKCDIDCSDYSDYDEPDELDCYSDVHDCVDTADSYAPTDVDFMHELHGPNNCGVYCQLRHEIRPYEHYAPTDVEFSHGMHDPANYDPGPGKYSPESGDMVAGSDFVGDIDPGPGTIGS